MRQAIVGAAVALSLALGGAAFAQTPASSSEGRPPDAKFDATTADQAKKKIEAAGYSKVTGLRKGYDAVWHGMAMKGASSVRVALTPEGKVFEEGN